MEDSEEDEAEVLVKEEDEVADLCNSIIADYWDITRDIVQTRSRNVPNVLLQITQLKTVHS